MPGKDRLDVDVPGESVADKRVKAGFADSLPSSEAVVKAKVKQACKVSRRGQVNAEIVAKRHERNDIKVSKISRPSILGIAV